MTTSLPAPALTGVAPTLHDEVLRGLLQQPRSLPAKFLYDDRGARLFERITRLDPYYLTRAEVEILDDYAPDVAALTGVGGALIEYGSGSLLKARALLRAIEPRVYVPIDIAEESLGRVARAVQKEFPVMDVRPVWADYTGTFDVPRLPGDLHRLAFFPGSTIGNFHPPDAAAFLRRIRTVVGSTGALLLGVDRRKPAAILHAAYNDHAGVTATFNLNVLHRLNRELGADFDPRRFRHLAFYNPAASRVEMHLVSAEGQTVRVAGHRIRFEPGESIWTESSYKYDEPGLKRLAGSGGFRVKQLWTDSHGLFWLAFLRPVGTGAGGSSRP
jgi:dimethylhistidine N-methyltransferase